MDNFLAMERKGRDLFKSLLEDGNIFFQQIFQQTRKNGAIRCDTK